jgi:hypothetical protein
MRNRTVIAGAALLVLASVVQSAEPRHADHEQLRAMLKTVAGSLNSRDFDALAPLVADKFSVVTMDQKRLTSLDEVKGYFNGFFAGDKPLLKKVTFNPQADALTDFLSQNVGVCHGSSQDVYDFSDGDTRSMASRWSAVVVKEHGVWELTSLHVGVSLMDNPVLAALKASLPKAAGLGALLGLVLGLLIPKALSALKG